MQHSNTIVIISNIWEQIIDSKTRWIEIKIFWEEDKIIKKYLWSYEWTNAYQYKKSTI
jgi:hypothetical protein